jgi:acyl carrier protein
VPGDPVVERTCKVVSEVFGIPLEEVTGETSQDSVPQWDSLNILNLLMAIESEFGLSISPEEAADFLSVELIVAILREKGAA